MFFFMEFINIKNKIKVKCIIKFNQFLGLPIFIALGMMKMFIFTLEVMELLNN